MLRILFAILSILALYFAFPDYALLLMAYIGAASLLSFAAFGLDKLLAMRGLRRIPEDALLILACIGGTLGAFAAQMLFRHKTKKPYFNRALLFISLMQTLLIIGLSLAVLKKS